MSATPSPYAWPYPPAGARPCRTELRLRLERIGYALWLSCSDPNEPGLDPRWPTRRRFRKMREFTGFFYGVEDKAVRVGVWASRPANLGDDTHAGPGLDQRRTQPQRDLCVYFEDLEIY